RTRWQRSLRDERVRVCADSNGRLRRRTRLPVGQRLLFVLGDPARGAVEQARYRTGALDQPAFERHQRQLGHVTQAELAHQIGAVLLDRFRTDVEELRGRPVGPALGDQLQDAALARGQLVPGRGLGLGALAVQVRVDQVTGDV